MTSNRSDSAEQLLKYLAYGMTSREALAYFLVEDEDVSVELLEEVCWMESGIEARINEAKNTLANGDGKDHWQSVKEDIASRTVVLELEEVSELLSREESTSDKEVNVDDE